MCVYIYISSIENQCRPNLCEPYERCVLSTQKKPICIRCQYSARFFAFSGECSAKISTCGDDGYLYKNYCALLRGQCEKNRYINIIDYDTCPKNLNLMRKIFFRKKNHTKNRFTNFRMN